MPNSIVLPYDPLGTSSTNRIPDEQQTVIPPVRITDASVVIPRVAPFFRNGLIVSTGTPGNLTPLTIDVDYTLVYRHISASRATGLDVYGGILLKNRNFNGNIWLDYQAIGEPLSLDDPSIVERFSRSLHNVLFVSFEQFTGLPSAWPVADHPFDAENVSNMTNVSESILSVAAAINAQNTESGSEPIAQAHLIAAIAHTPAQVGLGQLNNWPVAVQNDYVTGAANAYATAFGVRTYLNNVLTGLNISTLTDRITSLEGLTLGHSTAIDGLVLQFNGMATAVNGLEDDLSDIQSQVNTNTDALNTVTASVGTLITDYNALSIGLNNTSTLLGTTVTNLGLLTTTVSTNTDDITKLKSYSALRDLTGELPNGTFEFILDLTQKKTITVVGSGGNGGTDVATAFEYKHPRSKVGSFKLYLCTNVSTGNPLAVPVLVANVSAGADGQFSSNANSVYGLGGAGGIATVDNTRASSITATPGVDGEDGTSGSTGPSAGGTATDVSGTNYGEGADGAQYAGAGGSGGYALFSIENTGSHRLKYWLVSDIIDGTVTGDQKGYVKIING